MDYDKIKLFDLESREVIEEAIPGETLLRIIYQNETFSSISLRYLLCKNAYFSSFVGFLMKRFWSKRSIPSFINKYHIKSDDFEKTKYRCFNDFFIRKLKDGARTLSNDDIIAPCDGRYFCHQNISNIEGFYIKGQKLSLADLIGNFNAANIFRKGSMIISRLAPVDYHRFHFPLDCTLTNISSVEGTLHSVSPLALRHRLRNLIENKKVLIELTSPTHGNVLMIAVGATNVGSIHITQEIGKSYKKGDELGYFSFGGSMIITLFQAGSLKFDDTLTKHTTNQMEVLLKMGTSLSNCE